MKEHQCERCGHITPTPERIAAYFPYVQRGTEITGLCTNCGEAVKDLIEAHYADSISRLSPAGRCTCCKRVTHPATSIIFKASAWRRYEFCHEHAAPVLEIVAAR